MPFLPTVPWGVERLRSVREVTAVEEEESGFKARSAGWSPEPWPWPPRRVPCGGRLNTGSRPSPASSPASPSSLVVRVSRSSILGPFRSFLPLSTSLIIPLPSYDGPKYQPPATHLKISISLLQLQAWKFDLLLPSPLGEAGCSQAPQHCPSELARVSIFWKKPASPVAHCLAQHP